MSKIGAVAVLAVATLAGSASAQTCAPSTGDASRCHGPQDSHKRACCDGLVCMQKDEFYGQCRPTNAEVPEGWVGTILDYSETATDVLDTVDKEDTETDVVGVDGVDPVRFVSAGDVKYMAIIAKDYLPNSAVPKIVMVEDLSDDVAGNLVADQTECEDLCTATEGCNAASYYLDGSAFGNRNCWLKFIGEPCELPADADDDPNAVLLLQLDDTCEDAITALGPDGAMGPDAFGPESALGPDSIAEGPGSIAEGPGSIADGPGSIVEGPGSVAEGPGSVAEGPNSVDDGSLDDPTTVDNTGGDTTSDTGAPIVGVTGGDTTTVADSTNGVVSIKGAMIAMAVAGAAAFF